MEYETTLRLVCPSRKITFVIELDGLGGPTPTDIFGGMIAGYFLVVPPSSPWRGWDGAPPPPRDARFECSRWVRMNMDIQAISGKGARLVLAAPGFDHSDFRGIPIVVIED